MTTVSNIVKLERGLSIASFTKAHPALDDTKSYRQALKYWQNELLHVQQAYYHQKRRAVVVFEGWDAAGKGGAIRRITEKLDPRGYQVYPIGAPSVEEQSKHYLYRFFNKLPAAGSFAIFDRSYYGRVLVERIEGFASHAQWQRAYQEINEFERLLCDDDIKVVKLFLHISAEEQLKRFSERLNNPFKRWKLTEEDLRNRAKRDDYIAAYDDMFAQTDIQAAPWHIILAEHKWYARVKTLETLVTELSNGIDITPAPIDTALVERAKQQLGINRETPT